ncbi:MAG: type IV toxin-antitoxin system AbiEi family antitoxin domain-containing protein [Armatimonadota bacterium]
MNNSKLKEALVLIRELGVVRPRDMVGHGISGIHLQRLLQRGQIERVNRGIYIATDADITEHHSFAAASKRAPNAVICLLSALRFHDLTTQNPHEIWMAIGESTRLPKAHEQGIRFFRFSETTLQYGVSIHTIEGVQVPIYDPAKTVADCFKYRNKIGFDVALEALRDCWRQRKATMDELWQAAKVCRVSRVMRPYMESLVCVD